MKNFLNYHGWFTEKYRLKSDSRFWTFKVALNLLLQIGGKNIVETGTTRMKRDWGAGMSTYLFGDFAQHYQKKVWTVDNNPQAIEVCKKITEEFSGQIEYVIGDSVVFLNSFNQPIDLLYLDSYDYPLDGSDPLPCRQHQLRELETAWPKLSENAVILLDDNLIGRYPQIYGKTLLSKGFLKEKGAILLMDYQQSLFIR